MDGLHLVAFTTLDLSGGSSVSRPSTTSCSSRSPSDFRSWWPGCRRPGYAPTRRSTSRPPSSSGKLFLINFAMGVVTGIVQEFQFGMNWSDYSRFVGDVFGAPLAVEGCWRSSCRSTSWDCGSSAGTGCPEGAPVDDLDGCYRHHAQRLLHPRRQLVHAAPGRLYLQPDHQPRRMARLRRGAVQIVVDCVRPRHQHPPSLVAGSFVGGISAWLLVTGRSPGWRALRFQAGHDHDNRRLPRRGLDRRLASDSDGQAAGRDGGGALYNTSAPAPFSI